MSSSLILRHQPQEQRLPNQQQVTLKITFRRVTGKTWTILRWHQVMGSKSQLTNRLLKATVSRLGLIQRLTLSQSQTRWSLDQVWNRNHRLCLASGLKAARVSQRWSSLKITVTILSKAQRTIKLKATNFRRAKTDFSQKHAIWHNQRRLKITLRKTLRVSPMTNRLFKQLLSTPTTVHPPCSQ